MDTFGILTNRRGHVHVVCKSSDCMCFTSDPEFMPAPMIIPVSSSQLNVTWMKPTYEQSRGEVIRYAVWHYKANDLEQVPFAPPFLWTVSILKVNSVKMSHIINNCNYAGSICKIGR